MAAGKRSPRAGQGARADGRIQRVADAPFSTTPARRAQRLAHEHRDAIRRLHALGRRPVGEVLAEVAVATGGEAELARVMGRYRSLTPRKAQAAGFDDWAEVGEWPLPTFVRRGLDALLDKLAAGDADGAEAVAMNLYRRAAGDEARARRRGGAR